MRTLHRDCLLPDLCRRKSGHNPWRWYWNHCYCQKSSKRWQGRLNPFTLHLLDFMYTSCMNYSLPDVCRKRSETSFLKIALKLLWRPESSEPSKLCISAGTCHWPMQGPHSQCTSLICHHCITTWASCTDCLLSHLCQGRSRTSSLEMTLESLQQPKDSKGLNISFCT